ncbi:MAG: hypothetical protein KC877_01220 [Candidatus Kaiserbacteria bacterium]|nr:hypothetical protein [Candidatus Kaiserbacteria bacterium]MCB9816525.1 hypothetical protein [Candidatus Nomurabacteria bacterium]
MSDEPHKVISKFRTFASDIEAVKVQRGEATPKKEEKEPEPPVPKKDTGEHKAVAPKHHPVQAHIQEHLDKMDDEVAPTLKSELQSKKTGDDHVAMPISTPTKAVPPKPPTKIPSFHELQKQNKTVKTHIVADEEDAIKSKSHSKKSKKNKHSARPNIGFDATVITDTKSHRFNFFGSVGASISNWFKNLAKSHKRKKTPKYVVPETERRKGVIQRATSKTGTIFTADNETLKEHIRRRRLQEQEDEDSETSWSPYTETGYNLLEAPEGEVGAPDSTINVQVAFKKKHHPATPEITFTEPTRPVIPEPTKAPVEEPKPDPSIVESRWEIDEDKKPEPEAESEVIPEPKIIEPSTDYEPLPEPIEEPSEDLSLEELPEEAFETEEEEAVFERRAPEQTGLLNRFDTNTLTLLLLLSVVGLLIIIFVGRIIYVQLTNLANDTVPERVTESLVDTATLTPVTIQASSALQLTEVLNDAVATGPAGLVELPIVSPMGDELSADYLFDVLDFRTLPNLNQSITAVRFVSLNHAKPAIVFQFVDEDTVMGGLLQWEETMTEDLQPLYGTPASTDTSFVDETVSGIDVRTLRVEGKTILIYGIVGSNTVVIANSLTDFTQILERGFGQ